MWQRVPLSTPMAPRSQPGSPWGGLTGGATGALPFGRCGIPAPWAAVLCRAVVPNTRAVSRSTRAPPQRTQLAGNDGDGGTGGHRRGSLIRPLVRSPAEAAERRWPQEGGEAGGELLWSGDLDSEPLGRGLLRPGLLYEKGCQMCARRSTWTSSARSVEFVRLAAGQPSSGPRFDPVATTVIAASGRPDASPLCALSEGGGGLVVPRSGQRDVSGGESGDQPGRSAISLTVIEAH